MKLSYGGQCGHNGFMAYVGSGNRPVLSASHAGCIRFESGNRYGAYLCLSASHAGCILLLHNGVKLQILCLSASHVGCIVTISGASYGFTLFASAHPMWVASSCLQPPLSAWFSLPQRIPCGLHLAVGRQGAIHHALCLSASHVGCISKDAQDT